MLRVGTSFLYTFLLMGTRKWGGAEFGEQQGEWSSSPPRPRLTESWHVIGMIGTWSCSRWAESLRTALVFPGQSCWRLPGITSCWRLSGNDSPCGYNFKVQYISGASHTVVERDRLERFRFLQGDWPFVTAASWSNGDFSTCWSQTPLLGVLQVWESSSLAWA